MVRWRGEKTIGQEVAGVGEATQTIIEEVGVQEGWGGDVAKIKRQR